MREPCRPTAIKRWATACAAKKAERTLRPHDGVKILRRHIHERLRAVRPSIAEEDLKGLGRGNRFPDSPDIRHVEGQGLGRTTTSPDRRGGRLDLVLRAGRKRHVRAGLRERCGSCQADSAAGARYESPLAVEAEGGSLGKRECHSAAVA